MRLQKISVQFATLMSTGDDTYLAVTTVRHRLPYNSKRVQVALCKTGQLINYYHLLLRLLHICFCCSLVFISSPPSPQIDSPYSPIYPTLNLEFLPWNSARLRLPKLMVLFRIVLSHDPLNIDHTFLYLSPARNHYFMSVAQSLLQLLQSRTVHPPPPLLISSLPTNQLLQSYWLTKQCVNLKPPTVFPLLTFYWVCRPFDPRRWDGRAQFWGQ